MFVFSIVFYLSVKKLQILGVDKRVYTLANYFFPTVIFFVLAIFGGIPIIYPIAILAALFASRVIFNYVGTIFGYKSMEISKNAGYSLVIQKSYAAYTLFAATILFHSELSLPKLLISAFILICTFFMAYERGKKITRTNYKWVIYAVIAMVCFGTISLSSKYFAQLGMRPIPQLFWTCFFTFLVTGADAMRVGTKKGKINAQILLFLILLGVSVCGFYYFKLVAEIAAPNLGYVGTVNAASNAVYAVLVAILFKDSLSKEKLIAVGGITLGLILLFIL